MNNDVLDTHIVPGLSRAARALLSMTTRGFAYVAPPARTLDDMPTAAEVLEWIRLEHSTMPPCGFDTARIAEAEAWMASQPNPGPWSYQRLALFETQVPYRRHPPHHEAWKSGVPRAITGIDWSAPSPELYTKTRELRLVTGAHGPTVLMESHLTTHLDIRGSLHIHVNPNCIFVGRCRPFAGAYPLDRYPSFVDGTHRSFDPHNPGQDVADWTCHLKTALPGPTLLETLLDHL